MARLQRGAWQRKLGSRQDEQAEIDRILNKIHDSGLNSLSRRERNILQEATRRQQEEDKLIRRL
jgi:hypothetical protein